MQWKTEVFRYTDVPPDGSATRVPSARLGNENIPVSENKEDKKIFLTPTGAMIALICFFLPWVKVSCGRTTRSYSGPEIGGIFWLVLLAALVMTFAFFYFRNRNQPEKSRYVAIIGSIIALASIYIKYISVAYGQNSLLVKAGTKMVRFKVQIGAIGSILGFILILIGEVYIKTLRQRKQTKLKSTTQIPQKVK